MFCDMACGAERTDEDDGGARDDGGEELAEHRGGGEGEGDLQQAAHQNLKQ